MAGSEYDMTEGYFSFRRLTKLTGLCFIVLTAFVMAVCPGCSQTTAPQNGGTQARPVFAEKDGAVWAVCGDRATELGDAAALSMEQDNPYALSIMASSGSNQVYYISNYDAGSCSGDLMTTDAASGAQPRLVAQDVSAACMSAKGDALFCKNVKNGAGELWLCEAGGQPGMVAESVVPDMFGFSTDGGQCHYVRSTDDAYELYVHSGDDSRMLWKAEPPEFRYFTIIMDGQGGTLFGLGKTPDDVCLYADVNGQTTQVASSGEPACLFGAADDFLYIIMENELSFDSSDTFRLYYKAPEKDAVCLSEICCGCQFSGPSDNGQLLTVENNRSKAFLLAEQADDAKREDLYLCTIGGEKSYIGPVELYSGMVLGTSLKTAAVLQEDGLYLFHKEADGWTGPEPMGDCYNFISDGRYLYWLNHENVLNRCDLDTGDTKKLMDKAMDLVLVGDKVYVCVDNDSVCRLDGDNAVTLVKEGGDLTSAGSGVYVATFGGDIVYCPANGSKADTVLSGAEPVSKSGRFRYGVITDEARTALKRLSEDAEYYLDGMGIVTYADMDVPNAAHGTLEEDAVLARSLWPGTMEKNAWQAAGYFDVGFALLAQADETDPAALEQAQNALHTAIMIWDNYNSDN